DTVINHVRRALTQGADLLSAEERGRIDAALQALNQAQQGADRDLIRERTVAVNRATERLAEALMDRSLKAALAAKRADKIMEQDEEDRLDTAEGLTLHSRLGCQAVVKGDVVVEIPK